MEIIGVNNQNTQQPIIAVSGNLDFGTVFVGQFVSSQFTIYNNGNSILNIDNINITNGFTVDWSGGYIAPQTSKNIKIIFKPSHSGSYNGRISVNSNAYQGNTNIEIIATAQEIPQKEPRISVSETLNFGNVNVGQIKEQSFSITNVGMGTLIINSINTPYGFTIIGNSYMNILAGKTEQVKVRFVPQENRNFQGTISVNSNAGNRNITVNGYGVQQSKEPRFSPQKGQYTNTIYQYGNSSCGIYNRGESPLLAKVKSYDSQRNMVTFTIKKNYGSFIGDTTLYVKRNSECADSYEQSISNVKGKYEVDITIALPSKNGSFTYIMTVTSVDKNRYTHRCHTAPIKVVWQN